MAERVLSVEIGQVLTKVCEIERGGKTPKILNSFVFETPENMIGDAGVILNEQFITEFKRLSAEKGMKSKKVIFTVVSSRIATREAVIPYVKENRIQDIVRANLSEYFPVNPSLYLFSHSIIGIVRDSAPGMGAAVPANVNQQANQNPDGTANNGMNDGTVADKKVKLAKPSLGKPTGYKLSLLAAPRQLINSYEKLATTLGLEVVAIDYNGNSVFQAAKEECNEGVQMIVKIDAGGSFIMVLEDGMISLNRSIPYGISDGVEAIQRSTEFGQFDSFAQALDFARKKTVILNSFSNNMPDDSSVVASSHQERIAVTNSLRTLVGGILRVVDYYNSNHSQRPIEKGFITGVGADFSGISTLMSNELNMNIRNLTHLAGIDIEKVFKEVTYGEYVSLIGASIAPVSFYPDHEEGKSGKKAASSSSVNSTLIAVVIFAAGVIAAVAMSVLSFIPNKAEKDKKKGYERTIADLQPSYDEYVLYMNSRYNYEYMKLIEKETRNRNDDIVELINTLEEKMPYTFCLNSMVGDTEKITLDATVSSKAETAYVVSELKKIECFSSVDLASVAYLENELGEVLYGFSVELYYAPIEYETDGEDEEGEGE